MTTQTRTRLFIEPHRAIFPLVAPVNGRMQVVGTAFALKSKDVPWRLVTARHVAEVPDLMVLIPERDDPNTVVRLKVWDARLHLSRDVAVLDLNVKVYDPTSSTTSAPPSYRIPVTPLPIATVAPLFNEDILVRDYSPSQTTDEGTGGLPLVNADQWHHKGNVVRTYTRGGVKHMNTSFPTMRGCSGSPVVCMRPHGFCVVGMVVGNLGIEIHMPTLLARTEAEEGPGGSQVTTSYYLPYGDALALEPLMVALVEMGVQPECT